MVDNLAVSVNEVSVLFNELDLCCYLVLGQCRDNAEPKKLPIAEEEQIYPWDTCAAVHDVRLSLLQRYFKDVSIFIIEQFRSSSSSSPPPPC